MELGMYTYEEFKEIATKFHGYPDSGHYVGGVYGGAGERKSGSLSGKSRFI